MNTTTQLLPPRIASPTDHIEAPPGFEPVFVDAPPPPRPAIVPPAPTAPWRPDGLVRDALIHLRVRCDGTRTETAWRLAALWSRTWTFESTYVFHAWQALAIALEAGDDVAAEDAARWIADPGEAMRRAVAALEAKGGA